MLYSFFIERVAEEIITRRKRRNSDMKIVDFCKIDEKVTFIRIDPEDLSVTLKDIFRTLSDISWISKFDEEYVRDAFEVRAQPTINKLKEILLENADDDATKEVAEYLISELSREVIIDKLDYLDIPLSELLGRKVRGNPGFDFYSRNSERVILFGEAKYISSQNAYGAGLSQVIKFIAAKKDIADLLLIEKFCEKSELNDVRRGIKGFMVGFSAKKTSTDSIKEGIVSNVNYLELHRYQEIVLVAVNL